MNSLRDLEDLQDLVGQCHLLHLEFLVDPEHLAVLGHLVDRLVLANLVCPVFPVDLVGQ